MFRKYFFSVCNLTFCFINNIFQKQKCLNLIPRWGRFPEGGHSNPLQYPCKENPMDRGAWWATVHGVAELDATEVT